MKANLESILSNRLRQKRRDSVHRMVRAEAPSSTANLGPGFDVFGLALDLFHDMVEIELSSEDAVRIMVEGVGHDQVSREVQNNTAGLVAGMVMDAMKNREGINVRLVKGVPVGRGLGSSAASSSACVLALNEMFGLELSPEDLVGLAAYGEVASAGVPHYDNAAAAVLGGFVVVSQEPLRVAHLKPPSNLEVAVAIPKIELPKEKTKNMRRIIPRVVELDHTVSNVAHASLFVAGMALSDIGMIGAAMSDSIVEPVRSRAIPMFASAKTAALETGASGFAISGAGPTVIALCNGIEVNTKDVAKAMKEAFENGGVPCEAYTTKPSGGGAVKERR
jgi:homoserine kinase